MDAARWDTDLEPLAKRVNELEAQMETTKSKQISDAQVRLHCKEASASFSIDLFYLLVII
jgi:hypothetical protein